MRPLSILLTILLVGCNATPKNADPKQDARAPSRGVVLITVDGWWDPQTKSDAIPAEAVPDGARLTDAMTPSPQARPAIASILTGKLPVESGVRNDVTTPLPGSIALVPHLAAEKGWRSAAFVADPRVGVGSGFERGFEVFDPPKEILFGSFRRIPRVRDPEEIVADFSTWLSSVPEGDSFISWIHIARPGAGTEAEGRAGDVHAALVTLSKLIQSSPRLKGAAIALVGVSGAVDPSDGERSGYFLNADVLRVPVIVRSVAAPRIDPGAPYGLVDLARWMAAETGVQAPSSAGASQIAWSFRGRDEFGWPAEMAALQGSALCVRADGEEDRCVPWSAAPIADADRRACTEALDHQPKSWADPVPVLPLPSDLIHRLDSLAMQPRPGPPAPRRSVARVARSQAVPLIVSARRIEDYRKASEAEAAYKTVLAHDPGNFGAQIEAGEVLALAGVAKPARGWLEKAIKAAPSHPEAWHWLGHVSYLERQLDQADARWQVADALRAGNGDVLYDLACSRSIMGRVADSDAYLRRAWTAGFRDMNKIQVDSDLRNLRADPAFLRFMREVVH